MVTQEQADEIGHLTTEMANAARKKMMADSFGRINYEAYYSAIGESRMTPWRRLNEKTKMPWITAAQAVLKAKFDLEVWESEALAKQISDATIARLGMMVSDEQITDMREAIIKVLDSRGAA